MSVTCNRLISKSEQETDPCHTQDNRRYNSSCTFLVILFPNCLATATSIHKGFEGKNKENQGIKRMER